MINTPINIFINYIHVDCTFADRLKADLYQRFEWPSQLWNSLFLLWQEVLHA